MKNIKFFLKEKREKKCQDHRECNKNLSKEQKQEQVEYMKNYYLTHKNCLVA